MLDLYIIRGKPSATDPTADPRLPQGRGIGPLFEGLMAYRIHQDNLLWERTNTLIAVQAGLFAGAYALHTYPKVVALVLLAGAILSSFLFLIMLRHVAHRDANDIVMHKIFAVLADGSAVSGEGLRLSVPVMRRAPVKASYLLRGVALFFIVFDLYVAAVFLGCLGPPGFLGLPSHWPVVAISN